MTREERDLVRASFDKVAPIAPAFADLFYVRLFETDPKLTYLFNGNMADQGRKLMAMIGFVVANLHRIEELIPAIQDLARRHAGYGVKNKDYDTVGTVLIWTLGKALGPEFTQPVRLAWLSCYSALSAIMRNAV